MICYTGLAAHRKESTKIFIVFIRYTGG